jgi:hypothetical protein
MSIKTVASEIWSGIKDLFSSLVEFSVKIIKGVLNFVRDVVDYFKGLLLDPKKQTPFIVNAEVFSQQIKNAPRVDVGIFEGVYNEDTNTITDYREISADELDEQTKKVLSNNDGIVVLQ